MIAWGCLVSWAGYQNHSKPIYTAIIFIGFWCLDIIFMVLRILQAESFSNCLKVGGLLISVLGFFFQFVAMICIITIATTSVLKASAAFSVFLTITYGFYAFFNYKLWKGE